MTRTGIALAVLIAGVGATAQDPPPAEAECRMLNDTGRAREAAACYEKLLAALPDSAAEDVGARLRATLALARNRQWSGDPAGAVHAYERYLKADPANREATIEFIQVLRYQGDYDRAESLCDRLLRKNPDDAAVLALRAEVLYWAGKRGRKARRDAARAISIDPSLASGRVAYAAALEALGMNHQAWAELHIDHFTSDMARFLETRVSGQIRVRSAVPFSEYNDSDGIHNAVYESQIQIPIRGDHAFHASIGQYFASAPDGSIFREGRGRTSARAASLGADLLVGPGVRLSLTGGGWLREGDSIRPTYNAELLGSPWDGWTLRLATSRLYLPVTPRAMDRGILSDGVSIGAERKLDSRTVLGGAFERQWWSDGNRSYKGEAHFSRTVVYKKKFNWDLGSLTAHQAFARDLTAVSGFFTPDHYSRYDAFTDAHGEVGSSATWEIRGEGGTQKITTASDFRPDWAATARVSARIGAALWLYGSYERKNYSLLSRTGWYQGFTVGFAVHP